jgi:hypothetical protein
MNDLLNLQKDTKENQLILLEYIQMSKNQNLPLGTVINAIDALRNDEHMEDKLGRDKEYLKEEISKSIEILANLILNDEANRDVTTQAPIGTEVSVNLSNRIDLFYNAIMQEIRSFGNIQSQIKDGQERILTASMEHVSEGNKLVSGLLEALYQALQKDMGETFKRLNDGIESTHNDLTTQSNLLNSVTAKELDMLTNIEKLLNMSHTMMAQSTMERNQALNELLTKSVLSYDED